MSLPRISLMTLSSSVNIFSTFGYDSATGLINIMMLMSLEVVNIGNDFCLTTFSSLFNKKVNLNNSIFSILVCGFGRKIQESADILECEDE